MRGVLNPILLVLAGVLAYANSLDGPFFFDDTVAILENEDIRELWPPRRALMATFDSPVAGRPVVSLSLAVNYALGGLDVRGYHAVNVAVHIGCALVLYGIVRRTLAGGATALPRSGTAVPCDTAGQPAAGKPWHLLSPDAEGLALAVALLWLLHPLQTQVVDYVTQRTESIMALFYLLTLYCAIRAEGARRLAWSAASVACCAAGMASKEVMVTAPVMVVMYDWCFRAGPFREVLRRRAGLYASLAATWGVLGALMWKWPHTSSVGATDAIGPLDYFFNQGWVILRYLRLALWPHPLLIDYGMPGPVAIGAVWPALAALALIGAAALALFLRRSAMAFPAGWFFVILAPTSSLVPIVTEVGADRRMYLPLAGVIALAVIGGYALLRRLAGSRARAIGACALAAVAAALTWATMKRNAEYRSPIVLWQAVREADPGNFRAPNNLGILLREKGDVDGAIGQFREAARLRPDAPRIHYNLGNALLAAGRPLEAIPSYREALRLNPRDGEVHHNLAVALGRAGAVDEAVVHFGEALRIDPRDAECHFHMAVALRLKGDLEGATAHLRRALEIDPGYADAHRNLGAMLQDQGDLEAAIGHYRQALQSDPASAATRLNLGLALQAQGRLEEAIAQLETAARLSGDRAVLDALAAARRQAATHNPD